MAAPEERVLSLISISHLLQDLLNLETILTRYIGKKIVKIPFSFHMFRELHSPGEGEI